MFGEYFVGFKFVRESAHTESHFTYSYMQDQGIAIVQELCEARKTQQVPSELQSICILLLQITEMALYLEFCVSQVCGIRPVLGRVEDFSKEIRLFIKGIFIFLLIPIVDCVDCVGCL